MDTEVTSAPGWRVRGRQLRLDHPVIFGILNVTPDSFSDGGLFFSVDDAVRQAERLVEEGADALDVGGESTRPQGATPVQAAEERRRVIPVVRELRGRFPSAVLSVDTVKAEVAAAALDEGADVINDVSGLRLDARMPEVCAGPGAGVVLMHSRGGVSEMGTYEYAAYGPDPTGEVVAELGASVARAREAGVAAEAIVLDPGIGFAKRSEHSVAVLEGLGRIVALGYPVAVGASRKRFIGELSRVKEPAERVDGTTAANVMALAAGACIFRVHDVRPARRALDVAWAIARSRAGT
jgi:dihydropteroate synthase